jgi:hypothetical protein
MNLAQRNVLLAALAAALAIPTFLQLRRDAETFVDIGSVPLLFDGFTADNVMFVTLGQPKKEQPPPDPANLQAPKVAYDQLVFQRTDKGFALAQGELAGAPVGKDQLEQQVFQHLRSIRADRDVLVQPDATPEQLAEFGLDEKQAFVVRATDATQRNVVAELLVGRDAGQGQIGTEAVRGVFVRKSDSNDVILYEVDKAWLRSVQQDLWLDKVLARIEPDKVRRLSIRNAATLGAAFTFERPAGKASWVAVDAPAGLGAVRQTEVENLVQRLRYVAAQDYRLPTARAGNLAVLGLAPPRLEIDLVVQEGDRERKLKIAVGNQLEGKNEHYLMTNESGFVMTWPQGTVTQFELDVPAQCFDPAAPTTAPQDGDKKPADGAPAATSPGGEKPIEPKPADKPADGKAVDGKPADGKPADGKAVEKKEPAKSDATKPVTPPASGPGGGG